MELILAVVSLWFLFGCWAMFMWYLSFGLEPKNRPDYMHPIGLRPSVCLLALFLGPVAAAGWTLAYVLLHETRYFERTPVVQKDGKLYFNEEKGLVEATPSKKMRYENWRKNCI